MHVVVHIGPYKTGSTSIQKSLDAARDVLSDQRIFFYRPKKGVLPELALNTLFLERDLQLIRQVRDHFPTIAEAHDWSRSHWNALEEEAKAREPDLTVISSEHFAGLPNRAPLIQRLRETFDKITIVAYVREPADLYCSSLQQRIRGEQRLAQLPTPQNFVYPARRQLEGYLNLVGRENMVVRKFSRGNLVGGDVVTDFMSVISTLIGRSVTVPSLRTNESLPGAAVAWLLAINEAASRTATTPERRSLLRRLINSAEIQALPKLKLNNAALESLISHNAHESCSWINEVFLDGQEPLTVSGTSEKLSGLKRTARRKSKKNLRDWLVSYLTPEAIPVLTSVAIPLDNGKVAKKTEQRRQAKSVRVTSKTK